ncbi:hypothetical protein BDZ45DRAFT_735259 [Acephala macrosclerotiorum]|nr:hypothetical protein BDZ45DRAFT_735259 [Acephala macrosclerotiorum]
MHRGFWTCDFGPQIFYIHLGSAFPGQETVPSTFPPPNQDREPHQAKPPPNRINLESSTPQTLSIPNTDSLLITSVWLDSERGMLRSPTPLIIRMSSTLDNIPSPPPRSAATHSFTRSDSLSLGKRSMMIHPMIRGYTQDQERARAMGSSYKCLEASDLDLGLFQDKSISPSIGDIDDD